MIKKLPLLLAFAGLFLAGCNCHPDCNRSLIDITPVVGVVGDALVFPAEGGDKDATITTTLCWEVIDQPDWIESIVPNSGCGTTIVTCTAKPNATGTPRNNKITVRANNGDRAEILASQPAAAELSLKVNYTNGTYEMISVASFKEIQFNVNHPDLMVRSIEAPVLNGGTEVLIGRKANETITLLFDAAGNLLHRPADSEGCVPIGSYAEFQLLSSYSSGDSYNLSYKQEANLDLMEEEWRPITTPGDFIWTGRFDGNGYFIDNLKIDYPDGSAGLFAEVSAAVISNLHIRSGSVKGTGTAGGICGVVQDSGSFISCSNAATVEGQNRVGGIIGTTITGDNPIINCANSGKITGTNYVGGIVGAGGNANITNCSNSGEVTALNYEVGGIIGQNINCSIVNSYNTGKIFGKSSVGGIAGTNRQNVIACFNAGSVGAEDENVGGVVGVSNAFWSNVIACYNTGELISGYSPATAGAVAGCNEWGNITACYNTGQGWPAGLVGNQTGTTTACFWKTGTAPTPFGTGAGVDIVEFTLPYIFTPNTTLYPEWTINPDGTGTVGYWKDYSTGGLPKLWWE